MRLPTILVRWKHRLGIMQASRPTDTLDRLILRCISRRYWGPDSGPPRLQLSEDRFLLFFDGGSRGNPGPGGSGSVIVRVCDTFSVEWTAAMSFANHRTTNNYAEFQGLIAGLRAAVANNWHPLTVIGDSNMILSLMRAKKPPKAPSLRPLFDQARQAAASLRVTGWHHHYRVHNKMADKAANIAMDARRSVQATAQDDRPELAPVHAFLLNDVAPWAERLFVSPLSPDRSVGS